MLISIKIYEFQLNGRIPIKVNEFQLRLTISVRSVKIPTKFAKPR